MTLQAPFPWFGGKRRVAIEVWRRFGDVPNYVEPFFGSGAVLLGRPHEARIETVNDKDGFVSNFWRAVQHAPEETAAYADWPVNENDLHARHSWLIGQRDNFTARLEGDPDFYDAKIAGWWVWGICCWIGGGFCSGEGPWRTNEDGLLVRDTDDSADGIKRERISLAGAGQGVNRKRVHLGNAGQGVNRQLVHLGDAGRGVNRKLVHLGNAGQGVNRQLVHLGNAGRGVNRKRDLAGWFMALSDRLARVRVCSGDWARVCGPSPTFRHGVTGVFLDPPYSHEERDSGLYREEMPIATAVRDWAIENGTNPLMRIALCGYEGEHEMPDDWEVYEWKAAGGYSSEAEVSNGNAIRERIWFSPACLKGAQQGALL